MAASTAEHQSCSHFGFSEGSPWKETMIDLLLLPAAEGQQVSSRAARCEGPLLPRHAIAPKLSRACEWRRRVWRGSMRRDRALGTRPWTGRAGMLRAGPR